MKREGKKEREGEWERGRGKKGEVDKHIEVSSYNGLLSITRLF